MGGHLRVYALVVASGALAVVLALSGCDGGSSPAPDGSAVSSGTMSATTSATPTDGGTPTWDAAAAGRVPVAAREHSAAGAEAFLHFYVERLNSGFGDPRHADAAVFATSHCESCRNLTSTMDDLRGRAQRIEPAPYELGPTVELPESTPRARAFQFRMTEVPSSVVDSSGATVKVQPKAVHIMEILLVPAPGGWQVEDLALARAQK